MTHVPWTSTVKDGWSLMCVVRIVSVKKFVYWYRFLAYGSSKGGYGSSLTRNNLLCEEGTNLMMYLFLAVYFCFFVQFDCALFLVHIYVVVSSVWFRPKKSCPMYIFYEKMSEKSS
jgi:hypothetical protein